MKFLSVLVLPVSATLALNPLLLGRRFVNGTSSAAVSTLGSDTANQFATVVLEVPTEVVTGSPAGVTEVTVVEENETGTVTRTTKNTLTSYLTVTNTLTRTVTAPSNAVQDVINSAVDAKGVAAVGNTVVSKQIKTLTVTNYATDAQNKTQAVVDTVTVDRVLTKILDSAAAASASGVVSSIPFKNSTSERPIVSTMTLTQTRRVTITRPVTSTITNFITLTNSAGDAVETKTSVNEFIYNSVETVDTADKTVTSTVTFTTSALKRTVTNIIYFTYTYTVTDSNGKVNVRTATNGENVVQTLTHLMTVVATPTAEASATSSAPTVLSTSASAWNGTEPVYKRSYRHKHRLAH